MKSHAGYAKKLNRKRVLICMLVFFALLPAFSYLHEAGHALVCAADGNESEITIGMMAAQLFAMERLATSLHTRFLEACLQELLAQQQE